MDPMAAVAAGKVRQGPGMCGPVQQVFVRGAGDDQLQEASHVAPQRANLSVAVRASRSQLRTPVATAGQHDVLMICVIGRNGHWHKCRRPVFGHGEGALQRIVLWCHDVKGTVEPVRLALLGCSKPVRNPA